MVQKLPYLATPGSIETAFERIKNAATPSLFTNDFVRHVLKIKGGSGSQIAPYLKKIGFIAGDGSPMPRYDKFRNPTTSGTAVSEAMTHGYSSLYKVNEYAHELTDVDLKGLVVQVTGLEADNRVVALTVATFKRLKKHADFDRTVESVVENGTTLTVSARPPRNVAGDGRINLSYTINLNLPATTNIEVFHAIFASLKEHLIPDA
ncbi:MAG: DUF5343 domain-containing protein [Bacteroidetes bacterium]|nr:DUF5343 domain-containing protein [Bacteroidota bacterium]